MDDSKGIMKVGGLFKIVVGDLVKTREEEEREEVERDFVERVCGLLSRCLVDK